MSCRCPACRADYSSEPKCGLRLFKSENECAICLESCQEMVALPCGHQFCRPDLEHLGLFLADASSKKRKGASGTFRRRVHRSRHCSWCGHAGHTVRGCTQHREQCDCTEASAEHLTRWRHRTTRLSLARCASCGRRGHDSVACGMIVIN